MLLDVFTNLNSRHYIWRNKSTVSKHVNKWLQNYKTSLKKQFQTQSDGITSIDKI